MAWKIPGRGWLVAAAFIAAIPFRMASAETRGLVLSQPGAYDGQGAEVAYLYVKASDVIVQNYHVTGGGPGEACVSFEGDRITIRNIEVTGCGATGVRFWSGSNHVLEDSFIHDPVTRPGQDSWSVYQASAGNVTVRRVRAYGSGFSVYAPGGSALIEDSEFSIPDSYRTDCKGNHVSGGPCQCGEFGIALKTGNNTVRRNRIAGYRQADPVCGGSGTPGSGIDPAACGPDQVCPTSSNVIERNTISDSHIGIYLGPQSSGIRIIANVVCRNDIGISDGFSGVSTLIQDNAFNRNGIDYHRYGRAGARYVGNHRVKDDACPGAPDAS